MLGARSKQVCAHLAMPASAWRRSRGALGRAGQTVAETLIFLAFCLGAYALLSSLLSWPLWSRLRQRQLLSRWDIAVIYMPWLIWFGVSNLVPKNLSNVLYESATLAAIAPAAAVIHLLLVGRATPRVAAADGPMLVAMVGIGIACFVPVMSE